MKKAKFHSKQSLDVNIQLNLLKKYNFKPILSYLHIPPSHLQITEQEPEVSERQ